MKKTLFAICILLTQLSCSNDDDGTPPPVSLPPSFNTELRGSWRLEALNHEQKEYAPDFDYILEFDSDTSFIMQLMVNQSMGYIWLNANSSIDSINYFQIENSGGGSDMDKLILKVFPEMTSVSLDSPSLVFQNSTSNIIFKVQL